MLRHAPTSLSEHKCQLRDQRLSRTHLPPILPYSTLWEKLKRKIGFYMLASARHPDTHNVLKSSLAIANENKRLIKDYPWYTIHPLSVFNFYWLMVTFFVASVRNLISPFTLAFYVYLTADQVWKLEGLEIVCCTFLFVDFLLAQVTGYVVTYTTEIVLRQADITKEFFRKNFIVNITGFIPYSFFAQWMEGYYKSMDNEPFRLLLVVLYLFDVYRVLYFIRNYFHALAAFLRFSDSTRTLAKLVIGTLFVLHWTTCLWFILPFLEEITLISRQFGAEYERIPQESLNIVGLGLVNRTTDITAAWDLMYAKGLALNQTNYYRYVRALYITTLLTFNSSYGIETAQNDVSMVLASIIKIAGWLYYALCLLCGIKIMESRKISEHKYEEVLGEIKDFCEVKNLSKRLEKNILKFFSTKLKGQYFNEKAINDTISDNLRKDILMHTCQELVKKVELFKLLPKAMISEIVRCLTLEIYLANEVIIRAGTVGEEMFFIASGTASVHANGREITHLVDGDYFGEIALIFRGQRRTATVMAVEVCEVYKLAHQDFNTLFQPHKDLLDKLKAMAMKRLCHNKDEFRNEIIENFVLI